MNLKETVAAQYGGSALHRSAVGLREGEEIFRYFLEGKGYRTVLEIGTYKGVSAACISRYCEWVVTIDLEFGQLEEAGTPFDREGLWSSLGITNIRQVLVNNNAEKAAFIKTLDFDFAFIDGAHDHTVADDFAMVKKCGRVLFHDYAERPGKPNHVKNFVDTLGRVEVRDIFAYWRR